MNLLFATSEAFPYVKTGGLGEVANALPNELANCKDVEIGIFLPYYKAIKNNPEFEIEYVTSFAVSLSWRTIHCGIFKARSVKHNLTYYFIDNETYFYRDQLYGHFDDGERYAYFCKAILESLPYIGFYPDVIHCNDWQTGLIPIMLKANYSHIPQYEQIRTVFTIHNIEYQGQVSDRFFADVLGLSEEWRGAASYDGCINFMKSAIVLSDKITTVSKTYSYEIRDAYYAHGLERMLQENAYKIDGIVNGIDTDYYDPNHDPQIHKTYRVGCVKHKLENKTWLQEKLGLPVDPDIPLIAMVTRLVKHKGLELVEGVAKELMGLDMQFVMLGTGDRKYEGLFKELAMHYPNKMSANITFDAALANQIYAGADMLLMPSKSEPCGLAQLIAMRYGTIPIVRETGGLFDTVPAINIETLEGRGFTFKLFNAHDMLNAVERSLDFYKDKAKHRVIVSSIMKYDCSWKEPVKRYLELYQEITH
ncbi:glycogen synthase GlgA [Paenibacillus marinisediminis]